MVFTKYLKHDNSHFFPEQVPYVGHFKNCDYEKAIVNDINFY